MGAGDASPSVASATEGRLQLAFFETSKEFVNVHNFFDQLTCVINVVSASSKCNGELHEPQTIKIV
ncbi:hypothetical protein EJ110_NYTH34323 [Nymphaea thermarum]|nr:hypothetical protein EJ110_NYTH34323 [Nymphaea thermarum]